MKKEKKPALRIVAIVLVCAVLALAVYTAARFLRFRAESEAASQTPAAVLTESEEKTRQILEDLDSVVFEGVRYTRKKSVEAYLILGVDRTEKQIEAGRNNGQADVLLLAVLEPKENRYRVLQINRDTVTMVYPLDENGTILNSFTQPICLAHAYGSDPEMGCENTVKSVEYFLGEVEIDGYASINLEGVGILNDAVGGVTVKIDKDLTGADPSFTEGAVVKLNADTAEKYVRARMNVDEDDNLSRMARQVRFMNAWLDTAKAKSAQDTQFAMRLMDRLEPVLTTNMTEKRLTGLASDLSKYENGGFLTIDGEYRAKGVLNWFYPDPLSVTRTVLELFYEPQPQK